MDGAEGPAAGGPPSSADLLLLPLPPEPGLSQQGAGHGGGEDALALEAEYWGSDDATLLPSRQDDVPVPRSSEWLYAVQMDSAVPERRWPEREVPARDGDSPDGGVQEPELDSTERLAARFFDSVAAGHLEAVREQLREIHRRGLELTHPSLREAGTGKTCLMKALLRSQDKAEPQVLAVVRLLLGHAEERGRLAELLNASYTDKYYFGQTALHIAIEKGLKDTVRLLVEKGADLRARATGLFFQLRRGPEEGFYFGEYPLSLAACTQQPDLALFLLSRPEPRLAEARDSLHNTVLHALVLGAGGRPGAADMYELVLRASEERRLRDEPLSDGHLEKLRNRQGLTPLQLAAQEGQLELFRHIVSRELPAGHPLHHLSRRFLEWTYGPVSCSLYDLSQVDTSEAHSALKMVVSSPDMERASELLEVEPLRSLLESKWTSFAGAMFVISTVWYLTYMGLFTAIMAQWPGFQEPTARAPSRAPWRTVGQVYVFLSAVGLLGKTALDIVWMWPFQLLPFLLKSYFHILCLFQALLVLCSLLLSWVQAEDSLALVQGVALVLGWCALLYYSRGFRLTGIYTVVLQKMILQDVVRFLLVYVVFLLGFASALSALTSSCFDQCPYNSVGNASAALFKLTLGLGDLSGPEHSRFPGFFLVLLIIYVILTSVLLLNVLIALMNETVSMVSSRNEKIWRVQRAITILDLERCLPIAWRRWLQRGTIHAGLSVGLTPSQEEDLRTCLRVKEERRQTRAAGRSPAMGIHEDPIVSPGPRRRGLLQRWGRPGTRALVEDSGADGQSARERRPRPERSLTVCPEGWNPLRPLWLPGPGT